MTDFAPIPLVDLSLPAGECAETIKQACESNGFFYVVNHGVSETLIEKQFEQSRKFFEMPEDEKLKIVVDSNNRGYTPMKEETLDPQHSSTGDLKEGMYIGREIGAQHPEFCCPLHGPNQWPDDNILPQFRSTMEEYMRGVTHLGYKLLELLALSLGMQPNYFQSMFDRPIILLRPLHYAAQPAAPQQGVFSAGAHSDYGMLTILATDGVPGLQIYHKDNWMDVKHVPNALIINLGDMLERWTNGKYKSTLHRVVKKINQERYSTAFFFEPNFDTIVECLPSCVDDKNGAKYPPTTSGQHLLDKYNATHAIYQEKQQQQQISTQNVYTNSV
eukprot:TRINITY_DN1112_c0_g1_i1.p1 TRINITY_DN1112_c0_g1~~TRINITY_DN1112_c0_g1_i1.p1  ORF type:complete len:379 (-),score=45.44 TRINITY_DN1112_c0_g1_i1:465-1457(-)